MTDKKDDIVLSIRGMSKSFGRNRVPGSYQSGVETRNRYGTYG